MNGRSLHDALLRVLTDAPLRGEVLAARTRPDQGVGSAEAEVLRRADRDRIERMARFMGRHFYRERIVRLFSGTRALAPRTGRDPLAVLGEPGFREALAGGSKDGALVRVAASGALEQSRELALHYASDARSCLDGAPRREELEALTRAVVERRS